VGPRNFREYRLRRLSEELCPDCLEAERRRRNEENARRNAEEGLPALVGTEKQVLWAESIRREVIDAWTAFLDHEKYGDEVAQALEYFVSETRASWWIDHRGLVTLKHSQVPHLDLDSWLGQLEREGALSAGDQPSTVTAALEDAKVEATVRPADPKTESVAEVRSVGDVIEVEFPERREDFRRLVRFELGYSWNGRCWMRTISPVIGPVEERVVETAHRLLAAGFPIRLYDEELRRRAIEADFTPEPKRIIMKLTTGQHSGWFAIEWPRDEDYYRAARSLPGSRWDRPHVVVPPEQWEEIVGFAETYDFTLSPGAKELVEQARATQEAALVAPPLEPKRAPKGRKPSSKPPVLDVLEEVAVDDSLRDD